MALDVIDRNLTVREFLAAERISRATYYKLKKMKLAPAELHILRAIRITPEARRAWREKMQEREGTKAAKLEAARRVEMASLAGKRASKSPTHVSNRGKRRRAG